VREVVVTGPLLTAREVAGLLGVSVETVLRWTRKGELPAIRLPGGAIRYRPGELDDWLDARATAATGRRLEPAPDDLKAEGRPADGRRNERRPGPPTATTGRLNPGGLG
jgi:excisionase family DNA binding protein